MHRDDVELLLELAGVGARFQGSASEREAVKKQIKLGKSPAEIESKDRVERRAQHLGIGKANAVRIADEVKDAADTRHMHRAPLPQNLGLEGIVGDDNLQSSVFLERGAEAARSVCCILKNGRRIGTGFLVAPRVLMTNAHVIADKDEASSGAAEFNYEDKLIGVGLEQSIAFKLRPDELFISSPEQELDYTLVAVESTSDSEKLEQFSFLRLNGSVGKVLRGERLNIIQHPNGAPKSVVLRQNRFTALLENFMHYEGDTKWGSSGSPVFNDQWQVVCLHHGSVPLRDSQGRILTKDNRVWSEDESVEFIKWVGNEGVRISRIVADVGKRTGGKWPKLLSEFPKPVNNPSNAEEHIDAAYAEPVVYQSQGVGSPQKPTLSPTTGNAADTPPSKDAQPPTTPHAHSPDDDVVESRLGFEPSRERAQRDKSLEGFSHAQRTSGHRGETSRTGEGKMVHDAWTLGAGRRKGTSSRARMTKAKAGAIVSTRDDGVLVENTAAYPFRCICSLLLQTQSGLWGAGTGWLAGPRTVITTGHSVYMHEHGGWVQEMLIYPGRKGETKPFIAKALRGMTVVGWKERALPEFDYGAVWLDRDVPNIGSFGYAALDVALLEELECQIVGYPADKNGTMWKYPRQAAHVLEKELVFQPDTTDEVDGGPVFVIHEGSAIAVGISNPTDGRDAAIRITPQVFENIKRWVDVQSQEADGTSTSP